MKISTAIKRAEKFRNEVLEEMSAEYSDRLTKEGKIIIASIKRLSSKLITDLKLLESTIPAKEVKKRVRTGRINSTAKKVFERDGNSCQVCGVLDESCKILSCVNMVRYSEKLSDKITLCKNHMAELKVVLPWSRRLNRETTLGILIKMSER